MALLLLSFIQRHKYLHGKEQHWQTKNQSSSSRLTSFVLSVQPAHNKELTEHEQLPRWLKT